MVSVLILVLRLISYLFLARALASWFRPNPSSPLYSAIEGLNRITDPVLVPIRRVLPPMGGMDLSVIVVILGINFFLIPVLRGFL